LIDCWLSDWVDSLIGLVSHPRAVPVSVVMCGGGKGQKLVTQTWM